MSNAKVGRPVEKIGRKKIGLSLDGITVELLDDLALRLGKTKSKIVEESILLYYKNNQKVEEKYEKVNKEKVDPYYKLKDMMYNNFKDN